MTAVFLAVVLTLFQPGEVEGALLQVKAAVHVHTTFSTGALSLEEVIKQARREGIDAVLLTENFLLRFEYGLFPLRALLKKVVARPSVLRGVKEYLGAVEAAQARFPEVILIPGVEVIPYYYWTGSPFRGNLTMWDAQKNLLVVGLSRPEEYEQIPAIGNGARLPGPTGLLKLGLSVVAIGGGLLLLRTRREREVRLTHFTLKVRKRHWVSGLAALGVGVLLLLETFISPEVDPYQGNLGMEPYQRVIEYAESRGAAVVWSFPEARDFQRVDFGRLGTVVVRTEPYPDALLQSQGYTGLGAVYPDTTTFTEPGREWDQLLLEYSHGRRARPAWGMGEVGYHGPPKPLNEALTVFMVPERSRAAILQALKEGRLYALAPLGDHHLVLEDFSMSQTGMTGWTSMGGELKADGEDPLLISLQIRASDGRELPFQGRVIRSGRVVNILQGKTPFETELRADPPAQGSREFFRIEITRPHHLLSNPIFVRRRG